MRYSPSEKPLRTGAVRSGFFPDRGNGGSERRGADRAVVRAGHVEVPVAGGGIGTARAAAAALAAGADAVRVGTRFVAAEEASTHPLYAQALIEAGPGDTVLTEAFSVMWPNAPHRVLRSCVEAAEAFGEEVVGEMELAGQKLPVARFSIPSPGRSTTGAVEAMALYAGESVGAVKRVEPAASIVKELAEGAEAHLRRWCG